MLIFLSGPYGVGKSAAAQTLAKERNALIFDAEAVGNAVRDNYPDMPYGPVFEDYPLWTEFCCSLLRELHGAYRRDIVIPMTLMRESSGRNLVERLAGEEIETRLIVLTASRQTIHDRILARGEEEGCWCMQQIDLARAATATLKGAQCVDTEGRSIAEVVSDVQRCLHK